MFSSLNYLNRRLLTMALIVASGALCMVNAATFVVDNKSDSGAGSLRQAILDANITPGRDRITFNIGGAQPFNILLSSELPDIVDPVVIDATTQPGYAGAPLVAIVGANAPVSHGITLFSFDCEVRGLIINRFKGDGIRIQNGGRHWIAGNFIGTANGGNVSLGNRFAGVTVLNSVDNLIGGTNVADRNLISGNQTGVYITGMSATRNLVQGNFIGTDVDGVSDVGNTNNGVLLYDTRGNKIGGETAGARNVISANNQSGVYFLIASSNQVCGNFIGTTWTGSAALSNKLDGVKIDGSVGNLVGPGNVISGNRERGVYFINGAESNRIEGNLIGLAANGVSILGNRYSGVGFAVASNNVVGGTNIAARNVISGNQQSGVSFGDSATVGNLVAGNFIGTDMHGSNAVPNAFSGVTASAGSNNVVGGLFGRNIISGNTQCGVLLQAGVTIVAGNYIGTDVLGWRSVPNHQNGVRIDCASNKIGGPRSTLGNLISGNGTTPSSGVLLFGSAASNNVVAGNFIGTDAGGVARLANTGAGIGLTNSPRNWIGGPGWEDGNVISGNVDSGIYFSGAGSLGNRLVGNLVGTDAFGLAAVPNDFGGVYVYGSPSNTFVGNVISGNTKVGISIMYAGANGNVFQGNFIGLQRNGTGLLGNEWHGIELTNVVGTVIGGIAPGMGNRIGGARTAGYDGVRIRDNTSGAIIRGNSFFSNGSSAANGLAIDLGVDGVTLNDLGDSDSGPNSLQNFPVLATATGRYLTTISGTLNSRPNATFTLDFYGNSISEAYGEGERWLGAVSVVTAANGNASFSISLTNLFGAGPWISATATDASGNTSEFGATIPTISALDTDGDGIPDDFEIAVGLNPAVASGPTQDSDGDGATDLAEFMAGTDPRNATDALRMSMRVADAAVVISFPTVLGKTYEVQSASGVTGPWTMVAGSLAGTGVPIEVVDGNRSPAARYYRLRVN